MSKLSKREQALNDIQLVLEKHGASITASDHWQGYAECGSDIRLTIEFEDYSVGDIELKTSSLDNLTKWDCLNT